SPAEVLGLLSLPRGLRSASFGPIPPPTVAVVKPFSASSGPDVLKCTGYDGAVWRPAAGGLVFCNFGAGRSRYSLYHQDDPTGLDDQLLDRPHGPGSIWIIIKRRGGPGCFRAAPSCFRVATGLAGPPQAGARTARPGLTSSSWTK